MPEHFKDFLEISWYPNNLLIQSITDDKKLVPFHFWWRHCEKTWHEPRTDRNNPANLTLYNYLFLKFLRKVAGYWLTLSKVRAMKLWSSYEPVVFDIGKNTCSTKLNSLNNWNQYAIIRKNERDLVELYIERLPREMSEMKTKH